MDKQTLLAIVLLLFYESHGLGTYLKTGSQTASPTPAYPTYYETTELYFVMSTTGFELTPGGLWITPRGSALIITCTMLKSFLI